MVKNAYITVQPMNTLAYPPLAGPNPSVVQSIACSSTETSASTSAPAPSRRPLVGRVAARRISTALATSTSAITTPNATDGCTEPIFQLLLTSSERR
jgi:hypothetical protein